MHAGALTGRRILVVEDEYFIAIDLQRALSEADAEVVGPASDIAAGQKLVEQDPPDAAILDVKLEGALSYPLADWLTDHRVPHVFVTGFDERSLPERYRDTPRLTKPFAVDRLVDVVTQLCTQGDQR